jgi:hypothetical protein
MKLSEFESLTKNLALLLKLGKTKEESKKLLMKMEVAELIRRLQD